MGEVKTSKLAFVPEDVFSVKLTSCSFPSKTLNKTIKIIKTIAQPRLIKTFLFFFVNLIKKMTDLILNRLV